MKCEWNFTMSLVLILLLGGTSAYYQHEYGSEKMRAEAAEHNLQLANDTITAMQTRQRDVAVLDAKYTGELARERAENERLRDDVAAGKRRLQLNATCSKNGASLASGLGDATTPKLTGDAERDYWRLRDGIETITGQVKYLQDYIKSQCVN